MIYAKSTPKFLAKLKDNTGTVLDPDAETVIQVRILIQNALDESVLTRQYYKGASPGATWDSTRTKRKLDDDSVPYLMFSLSAVETTAAKGNKNIIQMEIDVTDSDIPTTNKRTVIMKGEFPAIMPSAS